MHYYLVLFLATFIPLIHAATDLRYYPDKIIPGNGNAVVESLRVTSVPNVFNWTHNNINHFIIFNKLTFDADIQYACFYHHEIAIFIKEELSGSIYGYCVAEICGNKRYIFTECQKKLIQNDEIDCKNVQHFINDFNEQKMPKNESKNVKIESQINEFLWFLFIIVGICAGNLIAKITSYTFLTHLQPSYIHFIHEYFRAPTDQS